MSSNQLVSLSNNELLMVMLELNKISESHTSQSNLNENIIDHVLSIPGKQLRPALTIVCSKLWEEEVDEKKKGKINRIRKRKAIETEKY